MIHQGKKIGLTFFLLSILLTLTYVGPVMLIFYVEKLGSFIDNIFDINNVSGTTYYISLFACIVALILYPVCLLKKPNYLTGALITLFLVFLIFLNAALFYFDIRFPDSRIDGQQLFDSVDKPLKTSFIYIVFGFLHDYIQNSKIKKSVD